jgi:hypothetical protein
VEVWYKLIDQDVDALELSEGSTVRILKRAIKNEWQAEFKDVASARLVVFPPDDLDTNDTDDHDVLAANHPFIVQVRPFRGDKKRKFSSAIAVQELTEFDPSEFHSPQDTSLPSVYEKQDEIMPFLASDNWLKDTAEIVL